MTKNIVVIAGNGLLFDLLQHQNKFNAAAWNPQSPSTWIDKPRLDDGREFLPVLPQFSQFLTERKITFPTASDFDHFDALLQRAEPIAPPSMDREAAFRLGYNHKMAEVEARHFLVGAISHLQVNVLRKLDLTDWRWAKWFGEHKADITAISSFNYDLLIEDTLLSQRADFYRVGLNDLERGAIAIHKPHGSIDFIVDPRAIFSEVSYPMRNLFDRNDTPLVRLDHLNMARLTAEIVLPAEATRIRNFQWVVPGLAEWKKRASYADHLVLAGLSYWPCDRDELDQLVAAVPLTAKVHMCNPRPSDDWVAALESRFGESGVLRTADPPSF